MLFCEKGRIIGSKTVKESVASALSAVYNKTIGMIKVSTVIKCEGHTSIAVETDLTLDSAKKLYEKLGEQIALAEKDVRN